MAETDQVPDNSFPAPRIGVDGKAVYDQEFFVTLARVVRERWNLWSERNPSTPVTFEGVDFKIPQNAEINFSGYEFRGPTNFEGAQFAGDNRQGGSDDDRTTVESGKTSFVSAAFFDRVNFEGASFGQRADFSYSVFGKEAHFFGAIFGLGAQFCRTIFNRSAIFSSATFGAGPNFSHVRFRDAYFGGARFGHLTNFSNTVFGSRANFTGISEDEWLERVLRVSNSWSSDRQTDFRERIQLLPRSASSASFRRISFADARFESGADFSHRNFEWPCDFTGTVFQQPPDFDDCQGLSRLDLYGSKIRFFGLTKDVSVAGWKLPRFPIPGWTTDSQIALRLRMLRKSVEDTKNHDLERDLYIEERKAERGIHLVRYLLNEPNESGPRYIWWRALRPRFVSHCLWIAAMGIYWLLADYGRSFVRPLAALVLSIFIFNLAHAHVIRPPIVDNAATLGRAIKVFSIANAVPFVGALSLEKEVKQKLLCGDQPIDADAANKRGVPPCGAVPSSKFQVVTLAQSIFSALCFFFVGLALRNYFKLR